MPEVMRGFAGLVGANVLGQVLGFMALTIAARRIGASGLGNYNFCVALASYFGLLTNAGVSYVAMREVSASRERLPSILSECLTLQGAGAAAGYVLLVVTAGWLAPNSQAEGLVPIVGLTFVVSALTLDWLLLGLGSRWPVASARVIGQVAYAALVPIVVTSAGDTGAFAWLNLLGLVITCVILVAIVRRNRLLRLATPLVGALRKRLWESSALGYSLVMIQLYNRADVLVLGWLSTAREVGLYAVANRLPYSIVTFANVWIQAVMPHSAKTLREDPDQFRLDLSRTLTAVSVLALAVAVGGVILRGQLMPALFGSDFAAAGTPFAILCVAMAFVPVEAVLSNALIAAARDRQYAGIVTGTAVLNVTLNVLLIPSMAASGSALATLASEVALVVATLAAGRSLVGLPSLDLGRLARGAIAVCAMCAIMLALKGVSIWLATSLGSGAFAALCVALRVFDPALWRDRHGNGSDQGSG